ncbi:hypothetical protein LMG28688_06519 [Paraburkholderia caffeinitolerans]|uniref:Uncharacterized protein n=1 Tax=Paraburkholderia caffeinitolerans TaxID=1723730 RepID=A0A6J5GUM6_9BURK|nr:hypothetical protein LMG28688_06519 [Paraburkholderia caffeinitolerans]
MYNIETCFVYNVLRCHFSTQIKIPVGMMPTGIFWGLTRAAAKRPLATA